MTELAYNGDHAMADGEDDTDGLGIPRIPGVGVIWGVVTSERRRLDQHAAWSAERFNSTDAKLERLDTKVEAKFDAVEETLNEIKEMLAGQAGGRAILKFFMQPAVVILGTICSVAGALLLHLLRVN